MRTCKHAAGLQTLIFLTQMKMKMKKLS